jgi:hypothetical protein
MFLIGGLLVAIAATAAADSLPASIVVEPKLVHLRNDSPREWASFPEAAEETRLERTFQATSNSGEWTLKIRQQDVKQSWRVLLNDQSVGDLIRDEGDIVWYLPIPAGLVQSGENRLTVEIRSRGKVAADDIRVGEIQIEPRPVAALLSEATLEVIVTDKKTGQPLPVRLTLVRTDGALQMTSAKTSDKLVVRPGVVYSADGRARFGVPAGKYVLMAGRGFEYSLAHAEVELRPGAVLQQTLAIERVVPTSGFVACDTHIHTLTHSGHGDATLDERLITLAGEGIELPIATDHNIQIDYREAARRLGVDRYFTPVVGNELTTSVGHFNIFPVQVGARIPNSKLTDWKLIFDEIYATPGVKVAILNHARDIHAGTRPFDPQWFNPVVGENFTGWPLRFNGMEILNSGATQNDPLQLTRDWLALLNRGLQVTPVGSSDSHDVARFIVGQGRTYIRGDDSDPGKLNVAALIDSFLHGRVTVSYGLLVDLQVKGRFGPGELAAAEGDNVPVQLRVLGPEWVKATKIQLYQNGQLVREEAITPLPDRREEQGVHWSGTWNIPRPSFDAHLVAVALGEGVEGEHWRMAKPYQPTSPEFRPVSLSVSGAVWLDGDGDGKWTSPRTQAERIYESSKGDLAQLVKLLAVTDEAVAAQALHVHLTRQGTLDLDQLNRLIEPARPHVQKGMRAAWQAWRDQELTRAIEH